MNILKNKYRFAAIVLLIAIFSHITVFHFALEKKVICEDEGEFFHIENVENNHVNVNNLFNVANVNNFEKDFCTDYRLDVHLDKNIVKSNVNSHVKLKKSFIANFDKAKQNGKLIFYNTKHLINVNPALESRTTIALII